MVYGALQEISRLSEGVSGGFQIVSGKYQETLRTIRKVSRGSSEVLEGLRVFFRRTLGGSRRPLGRSKEFHESFRGSQGYSRGFRKVPVDPDTHEDPLETYLGSPCTP